MEKLYGSQVEEVKQIPKCYFTYGTSTYFCVCGSCDLLLENNGEKESLTLNDYKKTVHLNKNIQAELKNYTKDTRVVVQYLGDING